MRNLCPSAVVIILLTLGSLPAAADDQKPSKCEPQPTCEFGNLIIKPGAPTPGLKPQDKGPPGIDFQGNTPPDFRGSYRLPDTAGTAMQR